MRDVLEKLLRAAGLPDPERAERLWAEYRAGGEGAHAAFATLMAWYGGAIYRRVWGFVRSEAADDVFQDVLVKLHRHRDRLATFADALRWLRTVAVAQCLEAHRGASRRRKRERVRAGAAPAARGADFELQEALGAALAKLPAREREAVALVYFEGMTRQDAAGVVGVHRDTLARLLDGALAKLRAALSAAAVAGAAATTATLEAALAPRPPLGPAQLSALAQTAWERGHAVASSWLSTKTVLAIVLVGAAAAAPGYYLFRSPEMPAQLGLELLGRRDVPTATAIDFGTNGIVTTPIGNLGAWAQGVALQPDGKIVTAGNVGVARYNADGTLDSTFNPGGGQPGVVVTGTSSSFNDVAVQADGKILVGGRTSGTGDDAFLLRRFTAAGAPDSTFGSNGVVTTNLAKNKVDEIFAVAVQPWDQKIIAVGRASENASWAVVRYNANGTLDTTFNRTGQALGFDKGSSYQQARDVVIQADRKIVVVGRATGADGYLDFAVARYNTDGTLDKTFGSGGKVLTDFRSEQPSLSRSEDSAYGVALQSDGKIVAAGSGAITGSRYAVARYNTDGSLDTTFAGDGKLMTSSPDGIGGRFNRVAVQDDNKIVAVASDRVKVARFQADGSPDTSFDGDGWQIFTFAPQDPSQPPSWGNDLVIQSDGGILVAGGVGPLDSAAGQCIFALARLNPDGSFDAPFPAPRMNSFTASSYAPPSGNSLTLTASGVTTGNPSAWVTRVEFYYLDATGAKQVLGTGTQGDPGVWALTFAVSLPPGTYTLYAQATDSAGAFGDPISLSLQVT